MTVTSEMLLRVAVAIATRRDAFNPGEKLASSYLDDARAAIEAMREPTDAMWFAPVAAGCFVSGVYPSGEETTAIWQAMIDAALTMNQTSSLSK